MAVCLFSTTSIPKVEHDCGHIRGPAESAHKASLLEIGSFIAASPGSYRGVYFIERFQSLTDPDETLSFFRDEETVATWGRTEEHRKHM